MSSEPRPATMGGPRGRLIAAGLALAGLVTLALTVPFASIGEALGRARVSLFVSMAGVYAVCLFCLTVRFWALMRAVVPVSFATLLRVTLVGQLASVALPSAAGADVARVGALVAGRTTSLTVAASAALLDRAVGLTTLAAMGIALGAWRDGLVVSAGTLALAVVPCGFVIALAVARLAPQSLIDRLPARAAHIAGDVRAYLAVGAGPRALALAFVASLLTSALQLSVYRGLLEAVSASPTSESKAFVGATFAFIATALPGLPGSIGTADAAFALLLEPAGVARADALAAFLLYRALWYASAAIGGVVYAVRPRTSAS